MTEWLRGGLQNRVTPVRIRPVPLALPASCVSSNLVDTAYPVTVKGEIGAGEDSPIGQRVTLGKAWRSSPRGAAPPSPYSSAGQSDRLLSGRPEVRILLRRLAPTVAGSIPALPPLVEAV